MLWLDAHADYNTPETSPSGNMHGMALSFLAGEESLAPILGEPPVPSGAGRRTSTSSAPARSTRARRRGSSPHGVDTVDMRQIDERGVSALLAERIAGWRARGVHLHVSFDVDFLDPAVAPGTGTVVPGGATYREAHLVMEMLCDAGSSARSTWWSSTPSSTSAAAPPSPPPSWWRASSAAPCSTASRAPSSAA